MRARSLASLALLAAPTARADSYVFDSVGFDVWHLAAPDHAVLPRTTTRPPPPTSVTDPIATLDERIGVGIPDMPYAALDVELGAFTARPSPVEVTLALASIGMQHRFGLVTVAGELAGGIAVSSEFGGIRDQLVLEPRARIDLAITDSVAIGGVFGISVVGDGWMAGIAVTSSRR